jgi:hypothetical protein
MAGNTNASWRGAGLPNRLVAAAGRSTVDSVVVHTEVQQLQANLTHVPGQDSSQTPRSASRSLPVHVEPRMSEPFYSRRPIGCLPSPVRWVKRLKHELPVVFPVFV